MRIDLYTKSVLTVIAALLAVLAFRPLATPHAVAAQSDVPYFYVEPGTTSIRAPDGSMVAEGKVVIDLRNGNIWGFRTLSSLPYPVNATDSKPPVSAPVYLGKFEFNKIRTQ